MVITRRYAVTASVVAVVVAIGYVLLQDPIRYGLGLPFVLDEADLGEARAMDEVAEQVENTAGPYYGPNFDMSDVPPALTMTLHGPMGERWQSELVSSQVHPGANHRGRVDAVVRLKFGRQPLLLASGSDANLVRCRAVTVVADSGIDVSSKRVDCPPVNS
ncbi:hypothetical protein FKR81_31640 [Lentzea tibetensis]|uniref:Uncharacterized protein n=1 Tax=Lentzea tibetensis TaxID=2591470 RepID=A0A563EM03_9PSEU|nr:hypothetical protein [Lentzea tibetensis]TWP47518.1 hypothetical protein FKR81_31640 [Lentzea tibetensis]